MKVSRTPFQLLLIVPCALVSANNDDYNGTGSLRWKSFATTSLSTLKDRLGNSTAGPAPSMEPSSNSSSAPTCHGNSTVSPSPTISPVPTVSPAPTVPNATLSPAPSIAPTHHNETASPAPSIAPTKSNVTDNPTEAPITVAPTASPDHHHPNNRIHIWRLIYKTLSWMIVAGLSVLAFGSCMSNRYRIYYYLRGTWFSFLRLGCTQSILRTLRLDGLVFGRHGRDTSLNDIIFEDNNDLHEGLLMRETIG
ncbi:hypothetical protein IV203_008263 [Nitzschia inconspicua]|uniref:Uncharacterized protein n=1 Tax=Nitzschia inconspicua TaxID=303405 RepID=A0A9K3L001_9STRA|nr:hypothetical protein IV203_008263 [Nitzschia inconspicua]